MLGASLHQEVRGLIRKPYPMEERTGDMDVVLYVAMSLPSDGRGDSDALQCV